MNLLKLAQHVRNTFVDVVAAAWVESDGVQLKLNVTNINDRVRIGNLDYHP